MVSVKEESLDEDPSELGAGIGQFLSPIEGPYGGSPFGLSMPRSTYSDTPSPYSTGGRARKTGGRRPKEEEETNLSRDELNKRQVRRQRNKEAAARCRQRRLDQMDELQQKVNALDQDISERDTQIQQLLMEKEELEYLLRSHSCANGTKLLRKLSNWPSYAPPSHSLALPVPASAAAPRELKQEPTLTQIVTCAMEKNDLINSLPTISDASGNRELERPSNLPGLSFGAGGGMSMDTPSSGLGQGFDLMSIPTGLTPVAHGALAPGFTPSSSSAPALPAATSAPTSSSLQTPTIMQRL